MVNPTVRDRVGALDFLRGAAILGILLANIWWFDLPMAAVLSGPLHAEAGYLNNLMLTLVNGKFRSLLAILFGVGIAYQFAKRSREPGNWPAGYLKRTALLSVIGLAHLFLLWTGDILTLYAATAFVACTMAHWDVRRLGVAFAVTAALAVAMTALLSGMGLVMTVDVGEKGSTNGAGTFGLVPASVEARAFSEGTYAEQTLVRLSNGLLVLGNTLLLVPALLPLFLLGLLLGKQGFFVEPERFPKMRNVTLAIGFGLGLPLNALALALPPEGTPLWAYYLWEGLFGPILGVGYLVAGLLLYRKARSARLVTAFESVGRTALTCYLMQSLMAGFVFYSYGLGLYGRLSPAEKLALVPIFWAANLVFAGLWLRWFAIGPVEWLWRSLTEGRRLPMRKAAALALDAPAYPTSPSDAPGAEKKRPMSFEI